MSSMGMVYDNADPVGYGKIIFHHIPNGLAEGFEACLIIYALCLGIMTLEITSNLDYDFALARRPGWMSWSKCPNRIAYFVSRYGSFLFLLNVLIFSTAAGLNCEVFGRVNQFSWIIPILAVDFIFIQRTMALYGWSRGISLFLYAYFIVDVAFAVAAVGFFGKGYEIPGSNFCAFYTRNGDDNIHAILFICYSVVLNSMDLLVITLTCHRLVEGGLLGIPGSIKRALTKKDTNRQSILNLPRNETISALLIRQGVHYYFILLITRGAYLIVYYLSTSGQSVYQVLCTSILATLGPVLANRLFRETSDFVRSRQVNRSNHNHTDDKIIPSRGHYGESNNKSSGGGLPLTMTTGGSTFQMQPMRNNTPRSTSYGEDKHDSDDYIDGFSYNAPSRSNQEGLKIYVNERMSSFIDDYDDNVPVALPTLVQRTLSYSEPPQPTTSSSSARSQHQRPFINTIPLPVEARSSSPPSDPIPSPPEPAFDIRMKRQDSYPAKKRWI